MFTTCIIVLLILYSENNELRYRVTTMYVVTSLKPLNNNNKIGQGEQKYSTWYICMAMRSGVCYIVSSQSALSSLSDPLTSPACGGGGIMAEMLFIMLHEYIHTVLASTYVCAHIIPHSM